MSNPSERNKEAYEAARKIIELTEETDRKITLILDDLRSRNGKEKINEK